MSKNLVIVGYGGMGSHHYELLKNTKMINVIGIFDIDSKVIENARNQKIGTYASYEEVLQDDNVDIILIATPNDVHCEIAIKAMNKKKHVLVEKPVAMNIKELEKMIKCANENKVKFTVNQNRRYDMDFLTAKRIYDNLDLGEIFHVESKVMGSRGIPGDWRGMKSKGGGMLFDWGIHLLDQMLLFTNDKIVSLYGEFSHITNEEVDDGFRVHLKYDSGMTALVEVGTCHFNDQNRWVLSGVNGTAEIKPWIEEGKMIILDSWANKDVKPIKAASGFTKTMAPRFNGEETIEKNIEFTKKDFMQIYENFVLAIENEEELVITHESLLECFKIIEDVFKSVKENKVIYY